jgi:hypothetical protein
MTEAVVLADKDHLREYLRQRIEGLCGELFTLESFLIGGN